jgi:hypothetical protein
MALNDGLRLEASIGRTLGRTESRVKGAPSPKSTSPSSRETRCGYLGLTGWRNGLPHSTQNAAFADRIG